MGASAIEAVDADSEVATTIPVPAAALAAAPPRTCKDSEGQSTLLAQIVGAVVGAGVGEIVGTDALEVQQAVGDTYVCKGRNATSFQKDGAGTSRELPAIGELRVVRPFVICSMDE